MGLDFRARLSGLFAFGRSERPDAHADGYPGDLVFSDSTRRYAIVSTITDNFVGLGSAFLLSLQDQLRQRDHIDVILVQAPDVAPLDAWNRAALTKLCPGLRIVDVDASAFLTPENMTRYDEAGRARSDALLPSKRSAYVKLNVLRFTGYEKVLLMDSDLVILDNFSELFSLPFGLAGVSSGQLDRSFGVRHFRDGEARGTFNTGVLLLGRENRGRATFTAAIDYMNSRSTRTLRDQSVLNHVLKSREKFFLPSTYNYKLESRSPDALDDPDALKAAKILHLVGRSKWLLKDPANEGHAIFDHFHALQLRTGVPFVLDV